MGLWQPSPSLSPSLVGLWLVPLGNIQVLACNQYLPAGAAELQPKKRLGGQEAAWQQCWSARAGRPSLGSSPLPQGPCCSLGLLGAPLVLDSHQPWAFGGFQSLCVRWRFPLFFLIFKAFTTSNPFIHVNHPMHPHPQLPSQHSSCRERTLRQTLPPLERSLHCFCWPDTREVPPW